MNALNTLADQNIERLSAKLEVHEHNADAQAERNCARLRFDPSPEGEALHNYLIKCTNGLFRGMANYRKYQATTRDRRDRASGVGQYGTQPDGSEDRGREAHERDGSELGADDSFGSGDGLDDRLERAGVLDPDRLARFREGEPPGEPISQAARTEPRPPRITKAHSGGVEQHGDELSGMGEIDENAPSEANFAETMSIVEPQESIQVAPNSGALAGLDNGAAQPGEGSTPEQGKAQASGPASSNPQPRTPDSSDRPCGGSLRATVSNQEKRRLQLEKERQAVERMVEEKLKAGNFAPGEILMTALAMPLSGGRGP